MLTQRCGERYVPNCTIGLYELYELLTRADADEINNLRQEKVATRPGGWTGMGKWRHLTLALSTSDLIAGPPWFAWLCFLSFYAGYSGHISMHCIQKLTFF